MKKSWYKFRGWREDIKEMLYFNGFPPDEVASLCSDIMLSVNKKDKNGKEVYEGDVVTWDGLSGPVKSNCAFEELQKKLETIFDYGKKCVLSWDTVDNTEPVNPALGVVVFSGHKLHTKLIKAGGVKKWAGSQTWKDGTCFGKLWTLDFRHASRMFHRFEVVGNKFENPELLND